MDPQHAAPWARFRGNPQQTGQAGAPFDRVELPGWTYPPRPPHAKGPGHAARGIFNSAVVAADGTVWSGDGSGRFSRLKPSGSGYQATAHETHRLIDTTPLLLEGLVYVACGDGWIWRAALDGVPEQWFQAPPPQGKAFINWFEGQLGVAADGRIVAPNDNFHIYLIEPKTGQGEAVPMSDQGWSLACIDPDTGGAFIGNNAMKQLDSGAANVYAFDRDWGQAHQMKPRWTFTTDGSVVASPAFHDGWVYVGSFDGFLYAFDRNDPQPRWKFATGDHLYASPAVLADGTIVQASCDGCVYGLEPRSGSVKWRFDLPTRNPLRSSPAVDDAGRVWLGTGDGQVLVIEPRPEGPPLVRAIALSVAGPRQAVNASPAIAPAGIVIGDSEGALHLLPWRAVDEAVEMPYPPTVNLTPRLPPLPHYRAVLRPTDPWGITRQALSAPLRPGEPLALSLDAFMTPGMNGQERVVGLLHEVVAHDSALWKPPVISGDRRYAIFEPTDEALAHTSLPLKLEVSWRHDPHRVGLRMTEGIPGEPFRSEWNLPVAAAPAGPAEPPQMLWYQRIAMSLPLLLPSYNQIGFETLVYGITRVAPLDGSEWLYMVTGWDPEGEPDAASKVRFPLRGRWDPARAMLRLGEDRVYSELNGFATFMERFALTCWFDAGGQPAGHPILRITYKPNDVLFYGPALEALGMGDDQHPIQVFGSGELGLWAAPGAVVAHPPTWTVAENGQLYVTAGTVQHLSAANLSVVVQRGDGTPVALNYRDATERHELAGNVYLRLQPPAGQRWQPQDRVWLIANGVPHLAQRRA